MASHWPSYSSPSSSVATNPFTVIVAYKLSFIEILLAGLLEHLADVVDGPSGLTIEEAAAIMHISRRSARHLRDKGLRKLEKWGEQPVLKPVLEPRFPTAEAAQLAGAGA